MLFLSKNHEMRQTCHLLVLNHRTMLFFIYFFKSTFYIDVESVKSHRCLFLLLCLVATLRGVRCFLFTSLFRHVWASIWTLLLVPSPVNCSLKYSARQFGWNSNVYAFICPVCLAPWQKCPNFSNEKCDTQKGCMLIPKNSMQFVILWIHNVP